MSCNLYSKWFSKWRKFPSKIMRYSIEEKSMQSSICNWINVQQHKMHFYSIPYSHSIYNQLVFIMSMRWMQFQTNSKRISILFQWLTHTYTPCRSIFCNIGLKLIDFWCLICTFLRSNNILNCCDFCVLFVVVKWCRSVNRSFIWQSMFRFLYRKPTTKKPITVWANE